ncbi:CRISPR-associated protein Cas5 [Syntrophomonas curvata]
MQVLVFDIRGSMAHFRMPDTTNTHASYPFIPPTTVRGLAGSILGLPDFTGTALVGIRIMKPVKSTMQQMSMLGKGWLGSDVSFNRPTTIELLVNPHYRIYWSGDYFKELKECLQEGKSYYHTYLGSAFALTFPQYIGTFLCESIEDQPEIECSSIVPINSIKRLITVPGNQYSRIGGVHYEYLGDRNFGRTCSVLYEPLGQSILLDANTELTNIESKFCRLESGESVCLW